MPSDEENFRTLLTTLQRYELIVEALQNEINLTRAHITELVFASATIKGLEKEKTGASLLVPIGGGSFIKAEVATTETLVVGMGANVSVEKSREEAKQIIDKRVAELERSRNSLSQQLHQVLEQMRVNRQQLDEMSMRLGRKRQESNVRKTQSRT